MQLRNLPNLVTSLRFILIIPVLWGLCYGHYKVAFYCFLLAGISDGVDGMLARWFNWMSPLGALLDPLADKLLLLACFLALTGKEIPLFFTLCVLGRDLWIMLGAILYRYYIGPLHYKPIFFSKLNTFFQILFILILIINLSFRQVPFPGTSVVAFLTFLTTVVSFIQYTWIWGRKAIVQLKNKQETYLK